MLKAPKFQQSQTTQAVYDLFVAASNRDDKLVTWRELTTATGLDRNELRGALRTVRNRLVADHALVFENELNTGYRLVADGELSEVGQRAIERSRRQQRRGLKKMDCAVVEKLTAQERVRHVTRRTVLELGLASSRPRTIKNVEQVALRQHNQLTAEQQIEAIREALLPKK